MLFPTVAVEGIGADEEAVPPVALVPYQFKVAPDKGVAVKATAGLLRQYATGATVGNGALDTTEASTEVRVEEIQEPSTASTQ